MDAKFAYVMSYLKITIMELKQNNQSIVLIAFTAKIKNHEINCLLQILKSRHQHFDK